MHVDDPSIEAVLEDAVVEHEATIEAARSQCRIRVGIAGEDHPHAVGMRRTEVDDNYDRFRRILRQSKRGGRGILTFNNNALHLSFPLAVGSLQSSMTYTP
jgi:hypothetical protein